MDLQNINTLIADYPFYLQLLAAGGIAMAIAALLSTFIFGILRATNRQFDSFTINQINTSLSRPAFLFLAAVIATILWGGLA